MYKTLMSLTLVLLVTGAQSKAFAVNIPRQQVTVPPNRQADCLLRIGKLFTAVRGAIPPGLITVVNAERVSESVGTLSASCSMSSGWLAYSDSSRLLGAQTSYGALPTHLQIQNQVNNVTSALYNQGLIVLNQLDGNNERWQTVKSYGQSSDGLTVSGPFFPETIVGYRRIIGGVPVVNSGVQMGIDDALTTTFVRVDWRNVAQFGQPQPLTHTWADAFARLQQYLGNYYNNTQILQQEIAYVDGGIRYGQTFYEPYYVYLILTEVPDPRGGAGRVMSGKRQLFQNIGLANVMDPVDLNPPGW